MRKYEELFRTSRSEKLTTLVLLADGLSSLCAEYGCEVSGEVSGEVVYVYYRNCSIGSNIFELEELLRRDVEVRFIEGSGGRSSRELLEQALTYALEVLSELRQYVHITLQTGVEYSLLVLKSGEVYVAEGSLGRISLPYAEGVVLEAHTHPLDCSPSERDLSTAVIRFMEGLYASAVVSPLCATVIHRVSLLSEEDLISIKNVPQLLGNLSTVKRQLLELGNVRILVIRFL
ncbi:MAG: hypothetical protein RMH84_00075 [Sulfolobales archaeon]|nr:hypothetical protein [Sulfolobales archaeon]MDW8009984.1 hypothetical protein [Sulfolobales archaeon]